MNNPTITIPGHGELPVPGCKTFQYYRDTWMVSHLNVMAALAIAWFRRERTRYQKERCDWMDAQSSDWSVIMEKAEYKALLDGECQSELAMHRWQSVYEAACEKQEGEKG